jgi:Tfp pilus assembly protein PilF
LRKVVRSDIVCKIYDHHRGTGSNRSMLYFAKAYAHLERGNLEAAHAICMAALAQESDADAHGLLAEISRRKNDLPEALGHSRRALELAPEQSDFLYALGALLLQAGAVDEAIQHLDRAIELRLVFDQAHDTLCTALQQRAKFEARYLASVITPTIGTAKLRRAIESIQAQTYLRVEHVIVIDGPAGEANARSMLPSESAHPCHVISLPFNTGAGGYICHRIYGACVYLVGGRYVVFLDEDNWFEPHHIDGLMRLVESQGLEWAYALRNIRDADGRLVGPDDCQSLGRWPVWNDPERHLVDMNCYLLRRDIAIGLSPSFYRRVHDQENPDFRLCRFLLDRAKRFDTNGDYTVNYTVGNASWSVTADYFLTGNNAMAERYRDNFPWRKA